MATEVNSSKDGNLPIIVYRGALIMATEGSFGDPYDVRRPHFPENLAVYDLIGPQDNVADADRYGLAAPDRVSKNKKLNRIYKRVKLLSAHNEADYDFAVSGTQVLATGPNNSGLTIGFGFDLGARFDRSQDDKAQREMEKAGFTVGMAMQLAEAAGLRGVAAGRLTAQLRKSLRISETMAINIIGVIYREYEKNFTKGVVHPAIEMVMTKINYWRGARSELGNQQIAKLFAVSKAKTGTAQLDAAIAVLKGYTKEYTTFWKFLEVIKGKLEAGIVVEFVDQVHSLEDLLSGKDSTFAVIKEAGGPDFAKQIGPVAADTSTVPPKVAGSAPSAPKPDAPAAVNTTLANTIKESVGENGVNRPEDVEVVAALLRKAGHVVAAPVVLAQLITAIKAFQKSKFTWKPDGNVGPGGKTMRELGVER